MTVEVGQWLSKQEFLFDEKNRKSWRAFSHLLTKQTEQPYGRLWWK
jgi:hypothetical protein